MGCSSLAKNNFFRYLLFSIFSILVLQNISFADSATSLKDNFIVIENLLDEIHELAEESNNPKYFVFEEFREGFKTESRYIYHQYRSHHILSEELDFTNENLFQSGALQKFSQKYHSDVFPIFYHSLAKMAAAYSVLYQTGVILNASVIVDKDEAHIAEKLQKLDFVMGNIRKFCIDTVPDIFWKKSYQATLDYIKFFSYGIETNLEEIKDDYLNSQKQKTTDSEVLTKVYFKEIISHTFAKIKLLNVEAQMISPITIGDSIKIIMSSQDWKIIQAVFRDVPVYDSGEVDGFEGSMERVFYLQIGFELLEKLLENLSLKTKF